MEPLKELFNKSYFLHLADEIKKAFKSFDSINFVKEVTQNLNSLSLNERMRNTSIVLKNYLPQDYKKAISILYNLYDKGYSVMDILDNYFIFVKITDLLNESQKYNIIPIICKYITVFHNIHEDEIELALFSNNVFANIDINNKL